MSDLMLSGISDPAIKSLVNLLGEVYKALQAEMPRLAAMGIRAILESVMLDKVGDKGNFKDNVRAFATEGHIATKQIERVNHVLDAGSAAIHRRYAPSADDVLAMLDLAEHLVESIYVHEHRISGVASRVPPRPPHVVKSAGALTPADSEAAAQKVPGNS